MPLDTDGTIETVGETTFPVKPQYRLSVGVGLLAFALYLGAQFLGVIGYTFFLAATHGFGAAQEMVEGDLVSVTIVGLGTSFVVVLLWMWFYILQHGVEFANQIGWRRSKYPAMNTVLLVATTYVAVTFLTATYSQFVIPLFVDDPQSGMAEQMMAQLRGADTLLTTIAFSLVVAIVAPILEEIVFRGYLQSALKTTMPAWAAIVTASSIFASVHGSLTLWPVYFMLGFGMGFVYDRTGSLKTAIAYHMANNMIAVGTMLMLSE
ncbi:hypothetical protein COB11_02790 [Candidatus Aerophobetes bacterium]|uniref:CAAX prenyl protease 2/Lysostaphin resistance protein A-like domain-containing protein n=1 Tax=Aerophobetes bacterium TaxID=2030807 RepID=A0A2A4YL14_UNCAE|nr:MAG: hypothetical protein COB11_02790 [Candidatus Aerophobetes bacterium]